MTWQHCFRHLCMQPYSVDVAKTLQDSCNHQCSLRLEHLNLAPNPAWAHQKPWEKPTQHGLARHCRILTKPQHPSPSQDTLHLLSQNPALTLHCTHHARSTTARPACSASWQCMRWWAPSVPSPWLPSSAHALRRACCCCTGRQAPCTTAWPCSPPR